MNNFILGLNIGLLISLSLLLIGLIIFKKFFSNDTQSLKENNQNSIKESLVNIDNENKKQQKIALRQMALGLTHELKNPITSIKALLQIVKSREQQVSYDQFNNIIEFEIERLDKIVEDFCSFADSSDLQLAPHNINLVLAEAAQIILKKFPDKNIEIKKEFENSPKTEIDRNKILNVFLNLLTNAVEAIPDYGGVIEIQTKKVDDEIEVCISDNGDQINNNNIDNIFLPFFTSKLDRIGLGLSISESVVESHKGKLELTQNEEDLKSFKITIPIVKNIAMDYEVKYKEVLNVTAV
jgi:signal transduction histidine kinase